jgi:hypothetical protein
MLRIRVLWVVLCCGLGLAPGAIGQVVPSDEVPEGLWLPKTLRTAPKPA